MKTLLLALISALITGTGAMALDAPPAPPHMGWSTYNYFVSRHDDALMRSMANAFVANGMRAAGYTILRIDGGWWGDASLHRWYYWTTSGTYKGGFPYQDGDPHVDPRNYPYGLKGLADYMHGLGMKLGFYLTPALSSGSSANYPNNGTTQMQPTLQGDALIAQHAQVMCDAGVDHLFYDGYDWNQSQGTDAYTIMASSLAKAYSRVNRSIVFSINSGWKWRAAGVADEWRTSPDINATWPTIEQSLATVTQAAPAGNGAWNNPDCLMVGCMQQTIGSNADIEMQSQMSLWCVVGAPLYTSYDWRAMNTWERYVVLNTEAIAVDQQLSAPGQQVSAVKGVQLWSRTLSDGSVAVALFNDSEVAADIRVPWNVIGLPAGPARVRDLWAHADRGVSSNSYTAKTVPPQGCILVDIKSGTAVIAPLAPGYLPPPGPMTSNVPLSTTGWTLTGHGGLANSDATDVTGYVYPGANFVITMPTPITLTRLLLDQARVGPNPWPYIIYEPRTTYTLEGSADAGATWTRIASGSMGPAYTIIDFPKRRVNRLRFTIVAPELTSSYESQPMLTIGMSNSSGSIYAFNLGAGGIAGH